MTFEQSTHQTQETDFLRPPRFLEQGDVGGSAATQLLTSWQLRKLIAKAISALLPPSYHLLLVLIEDTIFSSIREL